MKKKDLLLESFETKLNKVNLKNIYGGLVEIVPTDIVTHRLDGTSVTDHGGDSKNI